MNSFTIILALKYGISVDLKLLETIDVTDVNRIRIRQLGFGGKITAFPLVSPNFDWLKKYTEKVNNILP
jgi:hypothetical protein